MIWDALSVNVCDFYCVVSDFSIKRGGGYTISPSI